MCYLQTPSDVVDCQLNAHTAQRTPCFPLLEDVQI